MAAAGLTRIIGIGNPLMADDGLGIRAIELLQKEKLPEPVELIDGGCGGLKLLPLFSDCRKLIIIDAADFNATPGTIRILEQPTSSQLSTTITPADSHHIALPEILRAAEKLIKLPHFTLILMQIGSCHPGMQLTKKVEKALPKLQEKIITIL